MEQQRQQQQDDEPAEPPQPEPSYNPLVFLPPALCDMTATSIQYIGLTLTYASSFQMLRGAVIIFTGILSVFFLRRRLEWFRWLGMFFVIGGLVTVGTTDMIYSPSNSTVPDNGTTHFNQDFYGVMILGEKEPQPADDDDTPSASGTIIGDILIVCAQVRIFDFQGNLQAF